MGKNDSAGLLMVVLELFEGRKLIDQCTEATNGGEVSRKAWG